MNPREQQKFSPASTFVKALFATTAFAAVHSLLATDAVKNVCAQLLGTRRRDAYYRAVYNAQAIGTTLWLLAFLGRLPDLYIYRIRGVPAYLMHAGQAFSVAALAHTVYSVGILRFLGITQLSEGLTPVEAQGPARDKDGKLIVSGLFRIQRHPANFWPLGIIWLHPRMTYAGLGFALVGSIYMVAGSWHQDIRLRRAYGDAYERYRATGVHMFVPTLCRHE